MLWLIGLGLGMALASPPPATDAPPPAPTPVEAGWRCGGGATSATTGEIGAHCEREARDGPNEGTADHPVRPCHWRAIPFDRAWEDRDSLTVSLYFRLSNGGLGRTLVDGTTQHGKRRICDDDGSIGPPTWFNVTTLDDLVRSSGELVRRRVPAPALAISPPPEIGGVVNFGMWLAVANGEPISVQAGNGPWARTTATLTTTVWDMGNGDVVTCDGPGVVLTQDNPAWNEPDESPTCGYTYREIPPDDPYRVSVTATWDVTWATSAGTSGTASPIVLTTTFDYTTVEIQTIGVSG